MNSQLEDRLTAALHARADLVQPDGLAPGSLGTPDTVRPLRRRAATLLPIAAAAAAAAVVVGVVATGGDADRLPPPTRPAPATPTVPASAVESVTGDLDADGTDDAVWREEDGTVRIALSTGKALVLSGPRDSLRGLADLGGDRLAVVTGELRPQSGYAKGQEITVEQYDGDALVERGLARTDHPLFDDGVNGVVWVDAAGRLLEGERNGSGRYVSVSTTWWVLSDDGLVAKPTAPVCWDTRADRYPVGCPGGRTGLPDVGDAQGLPALFPERVPERLGVGRAFDVPRPGDLGHTALRAELTSTTELTVTVDGRATAVALPDGPAPRLLATVAGGGSPGFVVVRGDADTGETWWWVGVAGGTPALLGSVGGDGPDELVWLNGSGEIFSRALAGDPSQQSYDVRAWTERDGSVVAEPLGVVCIDFASSPTRYGRC